MPSVHGSSNWGRPHKSIRGHVLSRKRHPNDTMVTYGVRTDGSNPEFWELRMLDSVPPLEGQLVVFKGVRAKRGERSGTADGWHVVGRSFLVQNIERIVNTWNAGTPAKGFPARLRKVWVVAGRGEAWPDVSSRLPEAIEVELVDVAVSDAPEVARVLRSLVGHRGLHPDLDVVVLARGGGDVISLETSEVASALGRLSRHVATMLAVGHARDRLRIGAILERALVCSTPTDAAWTISKMIAVSAATPEVSAPLEEVPVQPASLEIPAADEAPGVRLPIPSVFSQPKPFYADARLWWIAVACMLVGLMAVVAARSTKYPAAASRTVQPRIGAVAGAPSAPLPSGVPPTPPVAARPHKRRLKRTPVPAQKEQEARGMTSEEVRALVDEYTTQGPGRAPAPSSYSPSTSPLLLNR